MDGNDRTLEERLARLEERISRIEQEMMSGTAASAEPVVLAETPTAGGEPEEPIGTGEEVYFHQEIAGGVGGWWRRSGRIEERGAIWWINRVGIGLILFGVAFLFKYSVDQGWLSEPVRVALGLILGGLLFGLGRRTHLDRPALSRVLLGGSIATFYITGFAAFQLFELVSYPVAFGYMVLVSVLAFHSALWQEEAVLSVLGAVGALATPFLLFVEGGSPGRLALYTGVVLAGVGSVYLFRGWRSLLWTGALLGWSVLLLAASDATVPVEQWMVEGAVLMVWLVFWLVPLFQNRRIAKKPGLVPSTRPDPMVTLVRSLRDAQVLTVLAPLVTLGLVAATWELGTWWAGMIALGGAALLAVMALVFRGSHWGGEIVFAHGLAAAALLTVAIGLLLEGSALLVAWTVEAAAMHVIVSRTAAGESAFDTLRLVAHLLFFGVLFWLAGRLATPLDDRTPILSAPALSDVAVLGLTWFAAAALVKPEEQRLYRIAAYAGLLAWVWRELSQIPNGNGLVTITWGAVAIGILVAGLQRRQELVRRTGLITLGLVVTKLFLVDLQVVEAIWRIMLFLGFGGLLLLLSYFFPNLWQVQGQSETEGGRDDSGDGDLPEEADGPGRT